MTPFWGFVFGNRIILADVMQAFCSSGRGDNVRPHISNSAGRCIVPRARQAFTQPSKMCLWRIH